MIKNSQPFGKIFQKTLGGIFFDSHCTTCNQSIHTIIVKLGWCRGNRSALIQLTYLLTVTCEKIYIDRS